MALSCGQWKFIIQTRADLSIHRQNQNTVTESNKNPKNYDIKNESLRSINYHFTTTVKWRNQWISENCFTLWTLFWRFPRRTIWYATKFRSTYSRLLASLTWRTSNLNNAFRWLCVRSQSVRFRYTSSNFGSRRFTFLHYIPTCSLRSCLYKNRSFSLSGAWIFPPSFQSLLILWSMRFSVPSSWNTAVSR